MMVYQSLGVTPEGSPPSGMLMGWAVGLIGILGLIYFVSKG